MPAPTADHPRRTPHHHRHAPPPTTCSPASRPTSTTPAPSCAGCARATDRLDAAKATDAWTSELLGRVLARRVASLQDDPRTTLFFGRIDTRTEHGEETFHIGRRHVSRRPRRPGRRRLARPHLHGVLPGLPRRADGRRAAPPLRRRPRPAHGLRGRAPHRRRRDRAQRHPRRGDRAAPLRPDARHRLDDPARAGRDRAQRHRHQHLRAGSARHRQDRGRPAPRRVAALLVPRAARPVRRARRRPEPRVPRPHRRRAARRSARRGVGHATDRHPARARPGARRGRHRRRHAQGRRAARRGAAPGGLGARRPRRGAARRASRLAALAGARVRGPATSSTRCSRAACATRPPATCSRSGSRTTCCCQMERSGDSPDDRVQDAVARSAPVERATSARSGRRSTRPPCSSGSSRMPRRSPPRAGRHPHARRAAAAAVGQPPRTKGAARWTPCGHGPARRGAPTCSSARRAWATSCSTRPRTSRPMQLRAVGRRARPGRSPCSATSPRAPRRGPPTRGTTPGPPRPARRTSCVVLDRGYRVPAPGHRLRRAGCCRTSRPGLGAPASVRENPGRLDFVRGDAGRPRGRRRRGACARVTGAPGSVGVIVAGRRGRRVPAR